MSIPPDAVVGLYSVTDSDSEIPLVVLFNPFLPADQVYVPDVQSQNEHVLSESGRIWKGTVDSNVGTPWNYSQFRTAVLLSAIDLLDSLTVSKRSDPVLVCRHLSAKLNSNDNDNGVLVGNWSGDYSSGVSPSAWTGSAEILAQFWATNRPVKFAQCWVFAGVFTSVLRTLGIPSTTVTNFSSAHESTRPYNRIVEYFYSDVGKPQPEKNLGSLWNFHVWNHVWMTRPDLRNQASRRNLSYDGWQAVDSTPQEQSMGLFQLGPAPLQAIKYGFQENFDCDFVISEVNADVVHYWAKDKAGRRYHAVQSFPRTVGRAISVKMPGSDQRMDITSWYKFPEGSPEERKSFENRPSKDTFAGNDIARSVTFDLVGPEVIQIGSDISVQLAVSNSEGDAVDIVVHAKCTITDYTGRVIAMPWETVSDVRVEAKSTNSTSFIARRADYERDLKRGLQTVVFNASAMVRQTQQGWSMKKLVLVSRGTLLQVITEKDRVIIGERLQVSMTLRNQTHVEVTGCILRVEGVGITRMLTIPVGILSALSARTVNIDVMPSDVGDHLLVATLDSDNLDDVVASARIVVNPPATRAHTDNGWHGAGEDDKLAITGTGTVPSSQPQRSGKCCVIS